MHIIPRKRLNDFASAHPTVRPGLLLWYTRLKAATFHSFAELREVFPDADQVGNLMVFNIGGNKVRLIAAVHYNRQKVYIRAVVTHAEYDTDKWKE